MINVDLRHLEQRLIKRFERIGVEKVRTRARQLVSEMRASAKQWLNQSRQMLGITANPWVKTNGQYPRSYKKLSRDSYGPNKKAGYEDNFLVDSVFYSIRIRDNAKSSTISINRGFRDDFTINSGGKDYAKRLNAKKYPGFMERITGDLDERIAHILKNRRFMDG